MAQGAEGRTPSPLVSGLCASCCAQLVIPWCACGVPWCLFGAPRCLVEALGLARGRRTHRYPLVSGVAHWVIL